MDCPNCDHDLIRIPTSRPSSSAPWLCENCWRGWWTCELTTSARNLWDRATRSFGNSESAQMLNLQANVERADRKAERRKNG